MAERFVRIVRPDGSTAFEEHIGDAIGVVGTELVKNEGRGADVVITLGEKPAAKPRKSSGRKKSSAKKSSGRKKAGAKK